MEIRRACPKYDYGQGHGPNDWYHSQGPQWTPTWGRPNLNLDEEIEDINQRLRKVFGVNVMPGDPSEADEMNGKKVYVGYVQKKMGCSVV